MKTQIKVLNLTKHIIKDGHVRLLSDINGKIPTSWLVVAVNENDMSLFKYYKSSNTVDGKIKALKDNILKLKGITEIQRNDLNNVLSSCLLDIDLISEFVKMVISLNKKDNNF